MPAGPSSSGQIRPKTLKVARNVAVVAKVQELSIVRQSIHARQGKPVGSPSGGIKPRPNQPHRVMPLRGWQPEPPRKPRRAIAVTVAALGLVLVALTSKFLLSFVVANGVHYERSRLRARTVAVTQVVDLDSLRLLTGRPEDERAPAFRALQQRLMQVRRDNRDVRFVYLMGQTDRAIVFLVDANDPDSPDYSPPGQVYEEATPELVQSFSTGEPFVEGPTVDRWGTWVSGLAPIKDPSSGRVLAVLGMDVDATRWQVALGACRVFAYVLIALLVGVVIFFSRRLQALR